MSMLPPMTPVVPTNPAPTPAPAQGSSNNGKDFANTLDKVQSQDQRDNSRPDTKADKASKQDAPKTDGAKSKDEAPKTDDAKTDTTEATVDGEVVVDPQAPQVTVPAAPVADVEAAVVVANIAAAPVEEAAAPVATTAVDALKATGEVKGAAPVDAAAKTAQSPAQQVQPQATNAPVTPATTAPVLDPTAAALAVLSDGVDDAAKVLSDATTQPTVTDIKTTSTGAEQLARTALTNTATATTNVSATSQPVQTAQQMPEPIRQVVQLVHPLRHHGDGDYKLTLQLYPEHLGKVEVAVALNQGQISMQLTADNGQSRQMLRDSMMDLRQQLQDSGLATGDLDVSDHGFQGQAGNETTESGQIRDGSADMDEDTFLGRVAERLDTNQAATDGAVDVRV